MIVCRTCGHQNPDQEAFCAECGAYLGWAAQPDASPDDQAAAGSTDAAPGATSDATPPEAAPADESPATSSPPPAAKTDRSAKRVPAAPIAAAASTTTDPNAATTVTPTAPIAPAAPALGPNEMACPNCATPNDLERTFCVSCGELLRPASAAPVVAAPPRARLPINGRQTAVGLGVVGVAVLGLALFLGPLAPGPTSSTSPSTSPTASAAQASQPPSEAPSASPSAEASASVPPPSSAPPPIVLSGTIAYANDDSGSDDIFIRDLTGGEATPVVVAKSKDWDPDLSSDGSRIAWTSPQGIRIADVTGTNGWFLTHHDGEDQDAAWAPDDETVAFASKRDGDFDLYLRPVVEGTTKLDRLTDNPKSDLEPAWAPNGRVIAFTRGEGKVAELMLIDLISRKVTRLTKNDDVDVDPSWAPDGERIAFVSERGGGSDIYVMDIDTRKVTQITTDGAANKNPVWSPDGRFIAYQALADGDSRDLFVMEVATREVVKQFEEPGNDRWPSSWR